MRELGITFVSDLMYDTPSHSLKHQTGDKLDSSSISKSDNSLVRIIYNDMTSIVATYRSGEMNGKVKIFDKRKKLNCVGLYEKSLPNGPFWVLLNDHQYAYVRFKDGKLGK